VTALRRTGGQDQSGRRGRGGGGQSAYIRLQELPMSVRANLAAAILNTVSAGNFDLYFAFFEVGLDLLKPGGHLAYITPNTYFTTRRRPLCGGS